jgi:TonB family protein
VALGVPHPRYTEEARRNRVEGVVIMRVLVGADGSVKQVKITHGLPDGLDEQAVQATYEMRFKPAMKDGKPVEFWLSMSIEFNLK